VAAGAIPRLLRCLSVDGGSSMLQRVAWTLAKLTFEPELSQHIVAAGALPAIMQLLGRNCSTDVEAELLRLLGNFAATNQQCRSTVAASSDVLPLLVSRLDSADVRTQIVAGQLLSNVAAREPSYRPAVVAAGGGRVLEGLC
jgi:hypothetical protein